MLVAHSESRIGSAGVRSTILLERAVRGTVVLRDELAFDSRFAAAAAGKLEPVGHVFLLLAGRFVAEGATHAAPVAHVLGDDELERVKPGSRTFRTDGPRAHVIQLRIAKPALRAPIGLACGPLALPAACWDAAHALVEDPRALGRLLGALGAAGATDPALPATVHDDEPPRFSRLWSALQPLYATYGGTASLKQLAASTGLSLRQISRDAKDLAATFGYTSGYRDALLVLRLRTAVLLLSAPGAQVADVARIVGYGSPIAMARAFRDAKLPAPSAVQDALKRE
ncbi:MAG TPA: AraC family transcriptional regulator [Kofleriaceae bacterium]